MGAICEGKIPEKSPKKIKIENFRLCVRNFFVAKTPFFRTF